MVRTSRPLVERMTLVWHDWFATSNEGVGLAAADARAEQPLPPATALGSFEQPAARGHPRPGDAALALRHREREGLAERELRARADGALHARRRPRLHRARRARAGSRADRLPQRLGRRQRPDQLPLRPRAPRHRARSGSSASGATSTGGTRAGSASSTAKHRSFFVTQALGLLHPDRRRRPRRSARSSSSTSQRTTPIRPVVEAILRHPRLYTGPRMVKPPVVYIAGHAARDQARDRHRGLDVARATRRASSSSIRRTSPAGTTTAGSTPPRSAPAGNARGPRAPPRRARDLARRAPLDPEKLVERALAFWGTPPLTSTHARGPLERSRRAPSAMPTSAGSRRQYPALIENALRQLIAVSPDLQTCMRHRLLQRVLALRRCCGSAVAEAGAGLPGDRARHAAAGGTGLDRAQLPAPLRRARARRLRRTRARARACSTRASRKARPPGRPDARARLRLPGRRRRLALAPLPAGDPDYRRLRPKLALPDSRARRSPEDTRLRWHPSAASLAHAPRRGQAHGPPGGRLHERRPVALHLPPLLGGRRDRRRPADRLARPLPRPRRARRTTRSRASPRRRPLTLAGDREVPVAASERRRRLLVLGAGRLGRRGGPHAGSGRDARRDAAAATPRSPARAAVTSGDRLRQQLAPFDTTTVSTAPSPIRSPTAGFPSSSPALAAMLGRRPAAPLRRAERATGSTTRTPSRPTTLAEGLKLTSRHAARVPARPRGARPRRPRAHARLVGVRPPGRGERLRGTDHGAAGIGFVMGTRVRGHDDRRVPGPAGTGSTTTATSRRLSTSAASTARCSSSGSGPTPRRSSRARAPSQGCRSSDETRSAPHRRPCSRGHDAGPGRGSSQPGSRWLRSSSTTGSRGCAYRPAESESSSPTLARTSTTFGSGESAARRTYRLPKALPGERQILNLRLRPGRLQASRARSGTIAALGMRADASRSSRRTT